MKTSLTLAAGFASLALAACATSAAGGTAQAQPAQEDLRAFPAATQGQVRHVIRLAEQADEDTLKVELILGQTTTVDCNHSSFGGSIETRTAQGWGYDYFVLPSLGVQVSTMMGCPPGSDREAFVTITPQPLIRYNSRLPLVVYAPEGVEVRYRLWQAGETRAAN